MYRESYEYINFYLNEFAKGYPLKITYDDYHTIKVSYFSAGQDADLIFKINLHKLTVDAEVSYEDGVRHLYAMDYNPDTDDINDMCLGIASAIMQEDFRYKRAIAENSGGILPYLGYAKVIKETIDGELAER